MRGDDVKPTNHGKNIRVTINVRIMILLDWYFIFDDSIIIKNNAIIVLNSIYILYIKKFFIYNIIIIASMSETQESAILKSLIDESTTGILLEDHNRMILKCNISFTEMFNLTCLPADLEGKNCYIMANEIGSLLKYPEQFMKEIDTILKNKNITFNDIVYLTNGKILERDYVPIMINNNYKGHYWHYRDITIKTKLYDSVVETENENSYILANIRHEISNPLNAIIGLSDILLFDAPINLIDDLKSIKNAGLSILEISNILLSKIHTKHSKNEDFDLYQCITDTIDIFTLDASEKKIKITFNFNITNKIYNGKKTYIKQILSNLINNAIKYTDYGTINIICENCNNKRKIIISDTGIGIKKQDLSNIFKPFSQLNANKDGVGLGLHLVLGLIRKIDGEINVTSDYGIGSKFIIII